MPDWIKTIAAFAPGLATAIGGPLAGLATTMATRALGLSDGDTEALQQAIVSGDPDVLIKLKQVEQDFQIQLKNLEVDLEKLSVSDRESARNRESVTGDSWTPRILAGMVVVGWMVTEFYVLREGLAGETVVSLTGTLGNALMLVLSYYFGSMHRPHVK
jgi:hypothetical protein